MRMNNIIMIYKFHILFGYIISNNYNRNIRVKNGFFVAYN